MLLPGTTLLLWAAIALVAGLFVWRWPCFWWLGCGIALVAAGAVYYPFVMANRPPNYYAILEFLASSFAAGVGVVVVGGGALWYFSPDPARAGKDKL